MTEEELEALCATVLRLRLYVLLLTVGMVALGLSLMFVSAVVAL